MDAVRAARLGARRRPPVRLHRHPLVHVGQQPRHRHRARPPRRPVLPLPVQRVQVGHLGQGPQPGPPPPGQQRQRGLPYARRVRHPERPRPVPARLAPAAGPGAARERGQRGQPGRRRPGEPGHRLVQQRPAPVEPAPPLLGLAGAEPEPGRAGEAVAVRVEVLQRHRSRVRAGRPGAYGLPAGVARRRSEAVLGAAVPGDVPVVGDVQGGPALRTRLPEPQQSECRQVHLTVPVGHLGRQVQPAAQDGRGGQRGEPAGRLRAAGQAVARGVQGRQHPGPGERVVQYGVQRVGARPPGPLHGGHQLPGVRPVGVAGEVRVQPGQQDPGQLLLGAGQLGRVGQLRSRLPGRRAALDPVHQFAQVGAVHGGVVEAVAVAVAVGVEPAPARAYDGAAAARVADAREAQLPGADPGVGGDPVEGVVEDIEPGGRRPLEGALEGVHLLQGAVGLDDDEVGGREAERLGEAGSAAQRGQDGLEEPYGDRAAQPLPVVEDPQEPAGIGVRGAVGPDGRRLPGGVREEEVHARGVEFDEGVEHGDGVVGHVHGAEQTLIEVAVGRRAQERDGREDQRMARTAVREAAVAVVGGAVPVEGDADPDAELGEEVEVTRAELESVGVDPQVEGGDSGERPAELLADESEPGRARQQGFPSVENHRDGGECMVTGMFGEPGRGP